QVFRWWDRAVPPLVAANARPVSLRGGVLTIHVASSTWAQELSYLREQLRASLALRVPSLRLKELKIRVGPLPDPPRDHRPDVLPPPHKPLPIESLPEDLARSLAGIGDNALRETIARAAAVSLAAPPPPPARERPRSTQRLF